MLTVLRLPPQYQFVRYQNIFGNAKILGTPVQAVPSKRFTKSVAHYTLIQRGAISLAEHWGRMNANLLFH